jgi:hypothetical protein
MGAARSVGVAVLLLAGAAARAEGTPTERLLAEARSFMEQYERDLRAGDREAVARRYDARGAWSVGHGRSKLMTQEELRTRYLTKWTPPESFSWKDLVYEAVGADAVLVTGLFEWKTAGKPAASCSYSGLLVGGLGKLAIRLEDESCALPPPPPVAVVPATPAK